MAKPVISFTPAASTRLDWPVEIKWPKSTKPGERGKAQGQFTVREVFVTFLMLPDGEVKDLQKELSDYLSELAEAEKALRDASEDGKPEAKAEVERIEEDYQSWRIKLLRRVWVGFPEKHGFNHFLQELPSFDDLEAEELAGWVEAIADYRAFGRPIEDAYWKMVNGGK